MKLIFTIVLSLLGLACADYPYSMLSPYVVNKLLSVKSARHDLDSAPALDLNDIADQLLRKANQIVKNRGMDPYELPDVERQFTWIWKLAKLYLTNGHFDGASTMKRNGNVKVAYHSKKKYLQMAQSILLQQAVVKYDYLVRIWPGITNRGDVVDDIYALSIQLDIGFSFESFQFSLERLSISDSGFNMKIHTGNIIAQKLADWLVKKYGAGWHKDGRNTFEKGLKASIEKGMNRINDFIRNILKSRKLEPKPSLKLSYF